MADNATLIASSAGIVASYVEVNKIDASDLPDLIRTVYATLEENTAPAVEVVSPAQLSAAQIRKASRPNCWSALRTAKAIGR
jgi:predicted transcriptional regulator